MIRPLCLVLIGVLCTSPAYAGDPKAVATEIAAARKSKDDAATSVAVKKATEAYNSSEDKAARSALIGELGKVLKDKKMDASRLAVVAALVEIGDAKAGWKLISRQMPHPKKTEEATPLQLAAVRAAGRLAYKSAIKPLVELAYKCKDVNAAAAATVALGGFGKHKKARVGLLVEIVTIGLRTRPGQSTDKNVSKEAQARWVALHPAVVQALNQLTGTQQQSFASWESVYKDNKKRPAALFPDE